MKLREIPFFHMVQIDVELMMQSKKYLWWERRLGEHLNNHIDHKVSRIMIVRHSTGVFMSRFITYLLICEITFMITPDALIAYDVSLFCRYLYTNWSIGKGIGDEFHAKRRDKISSHLPKTEWAVDHSLEDFQ
jgi:hypothetical protein